MKAILCAILVSLAFAGVAQSAESDTTIRALIGKWRLVEFYNDIGDGKGHLHWQKAGKDSSEIMELTEDGRFTVTTTAPLRQETKGLYKLETARNAQRPEIRFTASSAAAAGGTNTWKSTILVLTATKLELGGPGIEGSGRRYARMK